MKPKTRILCKYISRQQHSNFCAYGLINHAAKELIWHKGAVYCHGTLKVQHSSHI